MKGFHLTIFPGEFSVCRLAADDPLLFGDFGSFFSMTRTDDELSLVTLSSDLPVGAKSEDGWRCLKVEGPLAFEITGVLAALSSPLADAGVPIFVVSTYDTDYLLVKVSDLEKAFSALRAKGHVIAQPKQVKS